jgi:protein TonB
LAVFESLRQPPGRGKISPTLAVLLAIAAHLGILGFIISVSLGQLRPPAIAPIRVTFFAPPAPALATIPAGQRDSALSRPVIRKKKTLVRPNPRISELPQPKKIAPLTRTEPIDPVDLAQPEEKKVVPEKQAITSDSHEAAGSPAGQPGGNSLGVVGGKVGGLPDGLVGGTVFDATKSDNPAKRPGAVYFQAGMSKPIRIQGEVPAYTYEAERAGVSGVIILELTISSIGDVSDIRVLKTLPLLEAHVVSLVKKWKFQPARDEAGRPIAVIWKQTFRFRL